MNQYRGTCLCGACHYTLTGNAPSRMYFCHCSRCRKETGTVHGANVFFKNVELVFEKGSDNITHFKLQGTRKERTFCKTCGSPLPNQYENGAVVLPAGTLDEGGMLEPTAHIFYASRASWEDELGALPRFDELPH